MEQPSLLQILSQLVPWGKRKMQATGNLIKHPAAWIAGLMVVSALGGAAGVNYLPQKPPVIHLPAKIEVPVDSIYTLNPDVQGGTVEWDVRDSDVQVVPVPNSNMLICHFPKEGEKVIKGRTALGNRIACAHVTVLVGKGPVPPVPPVPPTPPDPPAPIPVDGFRVLIVLASDDIGKLPPAQQVALTSEEMTSYLNSKCAMGPDNKTREWRIWDDQVDAANESKVWQDAYSVAKGQTKPWIVVSNGKSGFAGPLPKDLPSIMELLKKYGG